jgi:hypothetical protein
MTLKYMQGFETMRNDTDFRAQGWLPSGTPMYTTFIPSITSIGGTSLHLTPPYQQGSGINEGTSTASDPGYFNSGITVNQAWLAGGFTFGANMRFNSGISVSYGAGNTSNPSATCFDGTNYWAIQLIGSTYNVAFSTNLKTWTVAAAQPAAMSANSGIFFANGTVYVIPNVSSAGTSVPFYGTTNQGSAWTTYSAAVASGTSGQITFGMLGATGNSAYPVLFVAQGYAGGAVLVGTPSGTMTALFGGLGVPNSVPVARVRLLGGTLVGLQSYSGGNCQIYFAANSATAAINTTAAWVVVTGPAASGLDIAYDPVSNLWVLATATGIWTATSSGAAGAYAPPVASPAWTQRYSTAGINSIYWTGTQLVASGLLGHIITSPDGITWTEEGEHILPVGVAGNNWQSSLYDGSKYVLFSDSTTGLIATTPDYVSNYACLYAQDGPEVTSASQGQFGIVASAPYTALPFAANSRIALQLSAASSGSRTVNLNNNSASANLTLGSYPQSTANLDHYYEIHCVKQAGTANAFTTTLYVDGSAVVGPAGAVLGSGSTDTTSTLTFCLCRSGQFVAWDDIYITLNDGTNLVGPLGAVNIVASPPTTDVSDEWVKTGAAASNALSVNQSAFSSQSANFVSSGNSGDKDVYSCANTLPPGYTVKAVQVEGYFTKTSTSVPVANIGIVSGGSEADSTNVTVSGTGPVYVYQVQSLDPNGNKAWTNAAAIAAQITLNHVT